MWKLYKWNKLSRAGKFKGIRNIICQVPPPLEHKYRDSDKKDDYAEARYDISSREVGYRQTIVDTAYRPADLTTRQARHWYLLSYPTETGRSLVSLLRLLCSAAAPPTRPTDFLGLDRNAMAEYQKLPPQRVRGMDAPVAAQYVAAVPVHSMPPHGVVGVARGPLGGPLSGAQLVDDHLCCAVTATIFSCLGAWPGMICSIMALVNGCDAKNAAVAGNMPIAELKSKAACDCIKYAWATLAVIFAVFFFFGVEDPRAIGGSGSGVY